ncbi:MAG TPA: prolyl oligopeptidase family serine peptidase [Allosphingosinicella sp.]
MRRDRPVSAPILGVVLLLAAAGLGLAAPAAARPLTIDDVLDIERIQRVALSPDGEWAAVVVQRAARPGEAYGRTYYDLDPARSDVWLVSRRTGDKRNLTRGAAAAAGFWCPAWSPDGARLAMLSTRPEGAEPRGGDNVRLYVWQRATGALTRLGDAALLAQTMGGSPMYRTDLRGGADGSTIAHRCSDEENAPFAWLDERRLLAVTLPPGGVSGLLDAASRPARHAAATLDALREGRRPTATAAGSGAERTTLDERSSAAILGTIDAATGAAAAIATVPVYPFRGELTVSVAPDGRRLAVLATVGAIPPAAGRRVPHRGDSWSVERRLGFVDIAPGARLRWTAAPPAARYPLDLFGWSPDSRRVALRARASGDAKATPLFIASAVDLSVARLGPEGLSVGGPAAGSAYPAERPVHWVDDRRLLAYGADGAAAPRADWWLLARNAPAANLTRAAAEAPAALRRSAEGIFFAVAGDRLAALNLPARRLDRLLSAALPGAAAIVWPRDPGRRTERIVVAGEAADGGRVFQPFALGRTAAPAGGRFALPRAAQLVELAPAEGAAFWLEATRRGTFLNEIALADGGRRERLALNPHLAAVDWGETRLVDYRGADGQALKAAVMLPPGYRPGRSYPTLFWVYPGYRASGPDDYFLDPQMGGFYNLHLFAARGYVVAIPSIPLKRDGAKTELLAEIPGGVLPAADRLVELGIADPDRLGLIGQSFGGYAVYALVGQSRRFGAAVAMAGFTDLTGFYTQFDSTARGYAGVEHEKSYNWSIAEARPLSLSGPPYEDYGHYWRNSPLAHVARVETPLLLIHGEQDVRAPMAQAESFFYSLYRRGRTARLLRYWGENHGLSQSPANVRDIFDHTLNWFRTHLGPKPAGAATRPQDADPN